VGAAVPARSRGPGKHLAAPREVSGHPWLTATAEVSSLQRALVFTVNSNIKGKSDSDGFSWEGEDVQAFVTLAWVSLAASVAVSRAPG